ncbi:hypothetical protein J3A83DRAFT_4083402, partial [Scleroderma citrinum]
NSLSPISCPPPELLATIFLEYTQQWHQERSLYTLKIPGWIRVSYVCCHWRNVALDYADLWKHLFFVSSEWLDELLSRSRTRPLIV